ncbi:hypothetical protein FOA52_012248 [Chlamydomonas sp. UWO 241]|nr:hypothetical protein FOA52_012248 [Chlamydomonas sp. UWO 241]
MLTLCSASMTPDGSVVYTTRLNALPVTSAQRELLRIVLQFNGALALDLTAMTMHNIVLVVDSATFATEADQSQTWLMNPTLEPQSFEAQLIPGTAVASSRRRELKQVIATIKSVYSVAKTLDKVYRFFDPKNTTSSTNTQLNQMQATLGSVAVGTQDILNAVKSALSTTNVHNALTTLGYWIQSSNQQLFNNVIGDQFVCLVEAGETGAGGSWEETMFGFMSGCH